MSKRIVLTDRPAFQRSVFILVTLSIVILIAAYVLAGVDYDLSKIGAALARPESVAFVVNCAVSISVGLLSIYIYSVFQEAHAERVLHTINHLGHPGLAESVLNQLDAYGGVCFLSYRLLISVRLSPCERFLIVTEDYEYRKLLRGQDRVIFRFKRATNEQEGFAMDNEPRLMSDDYKRYEFFMKHNECALISQGVPATELAKVYSVRDVYLNGMPTQLVTEGGIENAYSAIIPDHPGRAETLLKYRVQFPIGVRDFLYILFEYPAKDIAIDLDYSALPPRFRMHRVEFLGHKLGMIGTSDQASKRYSVSHDDWVIPKSGVMFVWFDDVAKELVST